jgi:hypothetical protein
LRCSLSRPSPFVQVSPKGHSFAADRTSRCIRLLAVPSSLLADRRREHRGNPQPVVIARIGSRGAVLLRSEPARFSSVSDDKVGGLPGVIRSERWRAIRQRKERTCLLAHAYGTAARRAWLRTAVTPFTDAPSRGCDVSDPAHTEGTFGPGLSSPTPARYCPLASANAAKGGLLPC